MTLQNQSVRNIDTHTDRETHHSDLNFITLGAGQAAVVKTAAGGKSNALLETSPCDHLEGLHEKNGRISPAVYCWNHKMKIL